MMPNSAARAARLFAWCLSLFLVVPSLSQTAAQAMGQRPHGPHAENLPDQHFVPGFSVPSNSQAFHNYVKWDHSKLPLSWQLAHCSGMSLFARQIFNWAVFDPSLSKLTTSDYRKLLRRIYFVPTRTLPGTRTKLVIPGYKNWNEMTQDPDVVTAIKDTLGDAIWDIKRRNWNWSPLNLIGGTYATRSLIELNIRETIAKNRLAMIYLTRGFKKAHAVLVYGYELQADRVRYTLYDSNHPGSPTQMDFLFSEARFNHPDLGMRDPWILHPYADELFSTQAYLTQLSAPNATIAADAGDALEPAVP